MVVELHAAGRQTGGVEIDREQFGAPVDSAGQIQPRGEYDPAAVRRPARALEPRALGGHGKHDRVVAGVERRGFHVQHHQLGLRTRLERIGNQAARPRERQPTTVRRQRRLEMLEEAAGGRTIARLQIEGLHPARVGIGNPGTEQPVATGELETEDDVVVILPDRIALALVDRIDEVLALHVELRDVPILQPQQPGVLVGQAPSRLQLSRERDQHQLAEIRVPVILVVTRRGRQRFPVGREQHAITVRRQRRIQVVKSFARRVGGHHHQFTASVIATDGQRLGRIFLAAAPDQNQQNQQGRVYHGEEAVPRPFHIPRNLQPWGIPEPGANRYPATCNTLGKIR